MKATELRIGNLVWNDIQNIPVKVNLKILAEQEIYYENDEKSWKPIPLTEEWLLKFGFKKEDEYWNYKGFKLWFEKGFYHINSEYLIHIDYVHQLQNLFFALTGESYYAQSISYSNSAW